MSEPPTILDAELLDRLIDSVASMYERGWRLRPGKWIAREAKCGCAVGLMAIAEGQRDFDVTALIESLSAPGVNPDDVQQWLEDLSNGFENLSRGTLSWDPFSYVIGDRLRAHLEAGGAMAREALQVALVESHDGGAAA